MTPYNPYDTNPARAIDVLDHLIAYARLTGHESDAEMMAHAMHSTTGEINNTPRIQMMTPETRNQQLQIAINRTLDNMHREITAVLMQRKDKTA